MINAAWHEKHRMPKNPTDSQRFRWHQAHAKACGCRPIPPKLAAEMRAIDPKRRKAVRP